MMTELTYLIYLGIAVPLTLWMAQSVRRNGRVFLADVFDGHKEFAEALNRLLVVGFYLVNLGFVTLFLRTIGTVPDAQVMVERLSARIGVMLLVLGVLHLINVWIFNTMRSRRRAEGERRPLTGTKPPVPAGY
ncbi:hypothetical protein GCM10009789_18990 [Kribbella sancticallisti]|uniref:Integral membrane protein n=1 Tax=Kribbella sancticallisti TaxID=460087 RepID=A0ABN2CXH8_9ACTN